jgi:hypothetical protein
MKYIKKLNIDFDQWGELNNNPGWHNMEFIEGETIDYYEKKYPKGTKVRIRKDSIYYKENTKYNPRNTIGYIYGYTKYFNLFEFDYIFRINWNNGENNLYKITDLEYYKE